MVSFGLGLVTWIAIVGNCRNAIAFASTKVPSASILVDQPIRRHNRGHKQHRRSQPFVAASTTAIRKEEKSDRSSFSFLSASEVGDFSAANGDDEIDSSAAAAAVTATTISSGTAATSGTGSVTTKGRLLLVLVASLYGSLNVILRFVYDLPKVPPSAAALSATRGWLAFFCFLPPLCLDRMRQKTTKAAAATATTTMASAGPLFRSGLELAVWGFLAQGLLNVGLVSTGSARASFLTQTSVLFTPLLSTSIGKQSVSKSVWSACLVALVGLVVLTMGASSGATAGAFAVSLSRGDLFVLGGALSWSMYLFRIGSLGPKHPEMILQGVKTGLMAVLYSIWWIGSAAMNNPIEKLLSLSKVPSWMTSGSIVWVALFFSAIGPGMIADVLQQKGQKSVSASEANILLSAEPVFATLFAVLLLGETSSLLEMAGGALILAAAVIASF